MHCPPDAPAPTEILYLQAPIVWPAGKAGTAAGDANPSARRSGDAKAATYLHARGGRVGSLHHKFLGLMYPVTAP